MSPNLEDSCCDSPHAGHADHCFLKVLVVLDSLGSVQHGLEGEFELTDFWRPDRRTWEAP